jgi:hypothetical protein
MNEVHGSNQSQTAPSFLNVLHVRGCVFDEHLPLPDQTSERNDGVRWSERRRQESERVQLLEPLAAMSNAKRAHSVLLSLRSLFKQAVS